MYTETQKQILIIDLQYRLIEGSITPQEALMVLLTLKTKMDISVDDVAQILLEIIPNTKAILKIIESTIVDDSLIREIIEGLKK